MRNIKCKTLVIGSKGMLGQELVQEFRKSGYKVFSWDKEEINIANQDEVNTKIIRLKPEIIVNAAAYNAVDKIEEGKKELAEAVNGRAVGYLAEVATAVDAVLVHYSTDYVFDGECVDGYREEDTPNPQNAYGRSKWLGEQQLLNQKSKAKNQKYYLIRTSRLFGKPTSSVRSKKSFVDVMLKLADEKDKLEVIDEELSSPTYVMDLARRTREIIEWKKPFGIYHVTNTGACTWYGWAKKIFEISGKSVKLVPVGVDRLPRAAKRPKYSVLLNTKLPPMRSWEEALEDYLNTINQNN